MSDSSFNTRPFNTDPKHTSITKKLGSRDLDVTRPLFASQPESPERPIPTEEKQIVSQHTEEIKHITKRIQTIITEHIEAATHMQISLKNEDLRIVISALRDHANGGKGEIQLRQPDEIRHYCLTRLFEELVEEPSNILYTTKTEKNVVRYDAMEANFWITCLNYLEEIYS